MREFCDLINHETGARCVKEPHAEPQHYGHAHFPGQVVSWTERVRQDKRGRRIGYNWWREFIMEQYAPAREQWVTDFEQTNQSYYPGVIAVERRRERRGGRREVTDWLEANPPPTLKMYLLEYAGMKDRMV